MNHYSTDNDRKQQVIKQAKIVFIVLLTIGLSIGLIVSIGVVKLMDYLGLT